MSTEARPEDALSDFSPQSCKDDGEFEEIPDDVLVVTEIKRSLGHEVNITRPENNTYLISYSSSSSDNTDFFSTSHVEVRVPEYYHPTSINIPDSSTIIPTRVGCSSSCSPEQAVVFVSPRGIQMQWLRLAQIVSGILCFIQICILGALYRRTTMPVSILLRTGNDVASTVLFEVSIDTIILMRLSIAVLYGLLPAIPRVYARYAIGIIDKNNYLRWVCYSISSPLLVVLVSIMVGVLNASALLYIFGLSCSTTLFFFMQERYEFPGAGGHMPTLFAWITGLIPWVGMGVHAFFPWGKYHEVGVVEKNTLSVLMYFTSLVGYVLYGTFRTLQYNIVSVFSDYMVGELAFTLLDITMNFLTTWIPHFAFVS